MNIDDAIAAIEGVDRRLNAGSAVDAAERTINLTGLYRRYSWGGGGAAPIPEPAVKQLQLTDRTGDDRWSKYFTSNSRDLAIYRSRIGFYWLLRYDTALGEHFLDHAGSAHEVATKYAR